MFGWVQVTWSCAVLEFDHTTGTSAGALHTWSRALILWPKETSVNI